MYGQKPYSWKRPTTRSWGCLKGSINILRLCKRFCSFEDAQIWGWCWWGCVARYCRWDVLLHHLRWKRVLICVTDLGLLRILYYFWGEFRRASVAFEVGFRRAWFWLRCRVIVLRFGRRGRSLSHSLSLSSLTYAHFRVCWRCYWNYYIKGLAQKILSEPVPEPHFFVLLWNSEGSGTHE